MSTGGHPPASLISANTVDGPVAGVALQAHTINGNVTFTPPRTLVPAQLPAPAAFFVDRTAELARLERILAPPVDPVGPPQLVMISGPGGSGKTALGLRWAHAVRSRFKAGQFFMDLRGYSPSAGPLTPAVVLERWLRALGVHPDYMPADVEEQAALWRSMTAGRPVLIVADNASSAEQIRPLLPGDAHALVVVTTRLPIDELAMHGALSIHLGPLDEQSSITLVERIAGPGRIQAEPQAARALMTASSRIPLDVCTTAAHLATHPERTVADLAASLHRRSTHRLENAMDNSVLDTAYDDLSPEEQDLYRLLAMVPGPDVTPATVAALADLEEETATRLLRGLTDGGLLQRHGPRFGAHDRIREHAEDRAQAAESVHDLQERRRRAAEWYLDTAVDAQRAVIPNRWYVSRRFRRPVRVRFTRPEALDWLHAELPSLLAVQRLAHEAGWYDMAWEVVEALWGLFVYRKPYAEWHESCRIGHAATLASGHLAAQARVLGGFGALYAFRRRFHTSLDHWQRALAIEEEILHSEGIGTAFEGIGVAHLGLGHNDRAITCFAQALGHFTVLGRTRGIALQWRHIGEGHLATGRYDEAIAALENASRLDLGPGEEYLKCRELTPLARAYLGKGDTGRAGELLNQNLAIVTHIGAELEIGNVELALADLAHHTGDRAEELRRLQQAHPVYASHGAPDADVIHARITALLTTEDPAPDTSG